MDNFTNNATHPPTYLLKRQKAQQETQDEEPTEVLVDTRGRHGPAKVKIISTCTAWHEILYIVATKDTAFG